MKICPQCHEEFVDRMESCGDCGVQLLDASVTLLVPQAKKLQAKEEFFKGETVALTEGGLDTCREMEKVLVRAEIPCAVYPVTLGCDDNAATLGSSCAVKYLLLVRVDDVGRCKEVLEGQFHDQVAKEGMGTFVQETVHLDAQEIRCPACNTVGQLHNGECGSCGLFLGEPV